MGRIGNVAFKDRALFEAAARELERLLVAREISRRCEQCATASFMDTVCADCNIHYREGRPIEPDPAPATQNGPS